MTTILWFKRDLRLVDNPALAEAARHGDLVLPLYIAEPGLWAEPDMSARQWAFIAESLEELRSALADRGADLVIRTGEAVAVLSDIAARRGAKRLVSHQETGNAWTYARDRDVAAWAREAGVDWIEPAQSGVIRGLKDRDGWAKARDRFMAQPLADGSAARLDTRGEPPGRVPRPADLALSDETCAARQPGGRAEGEALLTSFLHDRGRTYRTAMSSPVTGGDACSRLSAHLAWGTLSVREVSQATAARQREVRGAKDGWAGSLKSFQSRLAWRDHFMQKLEDAPSIEFHCLHSAHEGMRPAKPDPVRLAAWCEGRTGLPFVDACMRYLAQGGWLNFRMRSMLMAVASYHLWLEWRSTGLHLARLFTDYEPGIHWSQTQMQSGTTGMNTLRIYNPVKQGHDQDPDGAFTRRWVPELAAFDGGHVHEPWRWDGAGEVVGQTYPAPIVDVKAAAKTAKERVWAVRRGEGFRTEADRLVDKHGSRKDAGDHFRDDRVEHGTRPKGDETDTRKRRKSASDSGRQGALDL